MTDMAISKIKKELAAVKGDQKVNAVKKHIADTLTSFCRQDSEFAQAVVQTDKTLEDCCKSVMAGCGNSISDLEVYRKAVQFYFPGADIHMTMEIDLCASVRKPRKPAAPAHTHTVEAPAHSNALPPEPVPKTSVISLNLDDFLK